VGLPVFSQAIANAATTPEARLFADFAKSPGFSASFEEKKQIKLLRDPIVNRGRLYFASPSLFARHIDRPFRSGIFLKKDMIILWDGRGTKTVSLDRHPAVAALATSFLSLLQGDRKQLERNYSIEFNGSYQAWTLELLPKQATLKKLISAMSFSGKGLQLTQMNLTEASGDSSVTQFSDARPQRKFSESEKTRYFSVPKA
jgi:outer membrane lipoprotein-sorting protein